MPLCAAYKYICVCSVVCSIVVETEKLYCAVVPYIFHGHHRPRHNTCTQLLRILLYSTARRDKRAPSLCIIITFHAVQSSSVTVQCGFNRGLFSPCVHSQIVHFIFIGFIIFYHHTFCGHYNKIHLNCGAVFCIILYTYIQKME